MKKIFLFLLFAMVFPQWNFSTQSFTCCLSAQAQDSLRVLFLGNSYTSVNNLPQMVKDLSSGAGKTLIIDSNMPGGMALSGHLNNSVSQSKINQGNWDYIVLQEQSQIPTIDYYRYNDMYPALTSLKTFIEQTNPCAKIITYMTWGRRFGGQQCDPGGTFCSPLFANFNHMQDSLTSAYLEISDQLGIQCAPVGVIWKNILNDTTLVLHSADDSHPNTDGSYVTACGIFSSIWKTPSAGTTYTAGLTPARAAYYRQKSDQTVFSNPGTWNLYINQPVANFTTSASGLNVTFTNTSGISSGATLSYFWNFGDGTTSTAENPLHSFPATGTYTVSLVVSYCNFSDTVVQSVQTGPLGMEAFSTLSKKNQAYPNPSSGKVFLKLTEEGTYFYKVMNTSGQSLHTGMISKSSNEIDLTGLSKGCYLLELMQGNLNEMHLLYLTE